MKNGCSHSPGRAFLTVLLWAMVATTGACRPERNKASTDQSGAGSSGNNSSSVSGLTNGGAGASGSATAGAGGSVSSRKDTTGGGGAGAGGTTATTSGPPPANIPCTGNTECAATGQVCEPVTKLCVPCVKTSDCASGAHCLGNQCVTYTSCTGKADCPGEQICDTTRGVCTECTDEKDCKTGNDCYGGKCVPVAICQRNSDCSVGVCDTSNGRCIDCVSHDNCGASNKRCLLNTCRTVCTTNADCTSLGMVCDTSVNACKQCVTNKDCPASWYCLVATCVPDVCDATLSACNGTSYAGCSADGDVFNAFVTCGASKPCTARGSIATCGGVPFRDGGVSDGAVAFADAGASSCSGGTMADPCKAGLPKFTGSQTVDGNGSELCSLPYFVLNAQNAVKIINSNNVPTSQFETATARVGWSAAGLHAYIDVLDTSVQTASMADPSQAVNKAYQGDSIELFLASNTNVTGMTSKDSNTIHLIVPANGTAVSVKDSGNSGTSSALPTSQYAQMATRTGYAIEVLIPWPGSAPSAAGAIRFDMAINSADKNFAGIDKMRDGQLIYTIGSVSGSTTCQGSDGTVPWCDDRTWCQTTVQ
jgi:hypothetical protein